MQYKNLAILGSKNNAIDKETVISKEERRLISSTFSLQLSCIADPSGLLHLIFSC